MNLVEWIIFLSVIMILAFLVLLWTPDSLAKEMKREQKRFDKLVTALMDLDWEYSNRENLEHELENTRRRIDVLKTLVRKKNHE